jgi:hypothetical protein
VLYAHRPERRVVRAMPVMLLGLALALDVLGAASGLGAALQVAAHRRRRRFALRRRRPSAWRWC